MNFEFKKLDLDGAFLVSCFFAGDERGGFTKSFEHDIFKKAGIDFHVSEIFSSCSMKNVIRGLHFQLNHPQTKFVTVLSGKVWDVIVDLRKYSNTYKQWRAFELSAQNHLGLLIPKGFAHGFACFEDNSIMLYQCDGKYDGKSDTGIMFNDPEISIKWPVNLNSAIHSHRDLQLMTFKDFSKKINDMALSDCECWCSSTGLVGG